MAEKLKTWKVLILLFKLFWGSFASTHWVVTENGRIQAQMDSVFHLRRPYDLIALIEQEKRLEMIDNLYHELLRQKMVIDQKWLTVEGDTDLESRLYAEDKDCKQAEQPLADVDLYISTMILLARDGIKIKDHISPVMEESGPKRPDCTSKVELDYSMHTFEHLDGMRDRVNLTMNPEPNLAVFLVDDMEISEFGSSVAHALEANSTSWVLYNLASLYWRIHGDAYNAMECARRALYFSPRKHKDIALLSIGNIFHQSHHSAESVIVLHAAIDHEQNEAVSHFTLGNVYAVFGDYNRSVACYENALRINPDFESAQKGKHAILCLKKLEDALIGLHKSLQEILDQLQEYRLKQEQLLQLQEKFFREQAPHEIKLLGLNQEEWGSTLKRGGQHCIQHQQDGHTLLTCGENYNKILENNLQIDITSSLQKLLRNVETQAKKISDQVTKRGKSSPANPNMSHYHQPTKPPKFSEFPAKKTTMYEHEEWPSHEECQTHLSSFPQINEFPTVFLPPEDKGYEVHMYLNELIGLDFEAEHPLPWYPPVCEKLLAKLEPYDDLLSMREREKLSTEIPDLSLRHHLMKYVNSEKTVEAEIGQRILTALNKKVGPSWLLYTLAGLYWRVHGNMLNGLECLRHALHYVPHDVRDVVLVNLGSLIFKLGQPDDALKIAMEALSINNVEPATNYLVATVLAAKGNYSGAIHYLKQVLQSEPDYQGSKSYMMAIACKSKFSTPKADPVSEKEDELQMCSSSFMQEQFLSADPSETLICTSNDCESVGNDQLSEHCQAALQCFSARQEKGFGSWVFQPTMSKLLALATTGGQCGIPELASLKKSLLGSLHAEAIDLGNDEDHWSEEHEEGGLEMNQEGKCEDGLTCEEDEPEDSSAYESEIQSMPEGPDMPKSRPVILHVTVGKDGFIGKAQASRDFFLPADLDTSQEILSRIHGKNGIYPITPDECERIKNINWKQLTSTWLSISEKNIDIKSHIRPMPEGPHDPKEPFCDSALPPSLVTLDHIPGVRLRDRLSVSAESGLEETLLTLTGEENRSVREVGTQIALAFRENATSWVLATVAALYWRVVGNAEQAINCIRQALQYAPRNVKDIPLISLANIFHRAGLYNDALIVTNMALEVAPKFVVTHFTMGNIYTSKGDFEKAIAYYQYSLVLQPTFQPARDRLRSIFCTVLFQNEPLDSP